MRIYSKRERSSAVCVVLSVFTAILVSCTGSVAVAVDSFDGDQTVIKWNDGTFEVEVSPLEDPIQVPIHPGYNPGDTPAVPEPSSFVLCLTLLASAGMVMVARRLRSKRSQ